MLETAQHWTSAGVSCLPLIPKGKTPDLQALRQTTGRAAWGYLRERMPTQAELRQWFGTPTAAGCRRNVGVITGGSSGLAILDFDSAAAWSTWSAWAAGQGGSARRVLNESYQVTTARGVHLYVGFSGPIAAQRLDSVDVISGGGYAVGAGSVHPSGIVYQAIADDAPVVAVDELRELLPSAATVAPMSLTRCPSTLLTGVDLVAAVKRAHRIEVVCTMVQATGRPGWFLARCPVPGHGRGRGDVNPSLWVDTNRQLCGCFAGCHGRRAMDVIDLVAAVEGLSIAEAIRALGRPAL